jgi:hypothetical protein
VDFLREYEGLSFKDACKQLRVTPGKPAGKPERIICLPEPVEPPDEVWQQQAKAFVDQAETMLWSDEGQQAVGYLHRRGFNDDILKQARIGYNPAECWDSKMAWGLSEGKDVWLPRGIVIPTFVAGVLWRVQVRRPVTSVHWQATSQKGPGTSGVVRNVLGVLREAKGPAAVSDIARVTNLASDAVRDALEILKDLRLAERAVRYITVRGSTGNVLYNADVVCYGEPAVLVEGIFDALAIQQSAGDIVAAVSPGTTKTRGMRWLTLLSGAKPLLLALDSDDAGMDAAESYWQDIFPDAMRWRPSEGKDAAAMLQSGFDLRSWVQQALDQAGSCERDEAIATIADLHQQIARLGHSVAGDTSWTTGADLCELQVYIEVQREYLAWCQKTLVGEQVCSVEAGVTLPISLPFWQGYG